MFFGMLLAASTAAAAVDEQDFLPVEQAFRISQRVRGDVAEVSWDIADGYYLYRKKFKFESKTAGLELGPAEFPKGEIKHDEFFGDMEILRGHIDVPLPLLRKDGMLEQGTLEVTVQGCADAGLCYPPYTQTLALKLPKSTATTAVSSAADPLQALGLAKRGVESDLLPADQAFRFRAELKDANTIHVSWQIADGYFLYREKFGFTLTGGSETVLKPLEIPRGEPHHDQEFGDVEIFHRAVEFDVPVIRSLNETGAVQLRAEFQGCADRGVCYPPMQKVVSLNAPLVSGSVAAPSSGTPAGECEIGPPTGFVELPPESEQCQVADALRRKPLLATVASFLGMGLLLAFTPCIFPMIPILSGIIVGHGRKLTTMRAFVLSSSYVLASALTYAVFGVVAGLFGSNLQAVFQEPWVLAAFSGVFVLLALSMFDIYTLQMPRVVQSRLNVISNRQETGTVAGAAAMGALSTLIMGPCVAAPLAGALIYIGRSGDWMLGFAALFALGLGMGVPLLVIGASAGKLLPKAGVWMNAVKGVFGVAMLAVAVWLLSRILPPAVTLMLWALLLIVPAVYLGALDALPQPASGWRKLWKGLGIAMLTYGVLMLIGVASNQTDPLQPLRDLRAVGRAGADKSLEFKKVASAPDLDREIAIAGAAGKWVMLDFYADWCISCKEMERDTFGDPKVLAELNDFVLLQADVTANSGEDQILLRRFGLIGPPATLFFGPDREERRPYRVVGYMDAERFLGHLGRVVR